jgi:hypothetical protein
MYCCFVRVGCCIPNYSQRDGRKGWVFHSLYSLRERDEDIVESCSCVCKVLRGRKDSAVGRTKLHREIENHVAS